MKRFALGLVILALWPGCVVAQSTTTYTYDALGRLKGATTSGGANNGLNSQYQYDSAGNRTNVTVTGASGSGNGAGDGASSPTQRKVVVLPINGYTVLPIS